MKQNSIKSYFVLKNEEKFDKSSKINMPKDLNSSPKKCILKSNDEVYSTDLNRGMPLIHTKLPEDRKGESYDPSVDSYRPCEDIFWSKSSMTPYLALARTFEVIEETKGRLKMVEALSNYFCTVMIQNPEDLVPSIYLSINQLGPAYEGLELGVAENSLMKAICKATGRNLNHIKKQTHLIGDLGIVAEQSRLTQQLMFQPTPLTVNNLYLKLKEIAKSSGNCKIKMISDVFVACRFSEARYFIRSLLGKLRIGIAETSLLNALALAIVKKNHLKDCNINKVSDVFKNEVEETLAILKMAFCQCPNYDLIISNLLKHPIHELPIRCPMRPGMPIKPMLAQPTKAVHEILERFGNMPITCEWKYDGERAQIHFNDNGEIFIYSRNQENNTLKYPDIVGRIKRLINEEVSSFILDSEIVAWDVKHQNILPFQVLSTRKRKNVDLDKINVQVCVYIFDLLYLNGSSITEKSLLERRKLFFEYFKEIEGEWKFTNFINTNDMDDVQQFLEESIKGNCEGLMVKTLTTEATYEIAKRSYNWLKLKKDYISNVGDSLDLVVIGGYSGKGRRTGLFGGFLLACYDKDNEEYQSICKIGTGFTDDDLRTHANFFKNHITTYPKSYYRYDNSLKPDNWFAPVQVWEVKCADLSLSPVHRAAQGIIDSERGISLRFPRFLRIREDKSPENATNATQIALMYSSQDQIKNNLKISYKKEFESEFY